jgi:hypothetical protein
MPDNDQLEPVALSRSYRHFAAVIASGPATPLAECTAIVRTTSGGAVSAETISIWWHQWVTLRDAMKAYFETRKAEATLKVMAEVAKREDRAAVLDEALPPPVPLPDDQIPLITDPGVKLASEALDMISKTDFGPGMERKR